MIEADYDPVPRGNSVLPSRAGPGGAPAKARRDGDTAATR